MTGNKK
jgi:hypothetical protein